MTRANSRQDRGTGGIKALLTALAVAGTVGGWVHLTSSEAAEDTVTEPSPTPLALQLAPLPTLVPEPTAVDAPPQPAAPTPTAMVLRRVDEPASAPSSASRGGGGGGGSARTRSS